MGGQCNCQDCASQNCMLITLRLGYTRQFCINAAIQDICQIHFTEYGKWIHIQRERKQKEKDSQLKHGVWMIWLVSKGGAMFVLWIGGYVFTKVCMSAQDTPKVLHVIRNLSWNYRSTSFIQTKLKHKIFQDYWGFGWIQLGVRLEVWIKRPYMTKCVPKIKKNIKKDHTWHLQVTENIESC